MLPKGFKSKQEYDFPNIINVCVYIGECSANCRHCPVGSTPKGQRIERFGFKHFLDLSDRGSAVPSKIMIERKINYYLKNKNKLRKSGFSLLKRIISIISKHKIKPSNIGKLKKVLLSEDFLTGGFLSSIEFKKVYGMLTASEKRKMLKILDDSVKTCLYSNHLYNLKAFYSEIRYSVRKISPRIRKLNNLYFWRV